MIQMTAYDDRLYIDSQEPNYHDSHSILCQQEGEDDFAFAERLLEAFNFCT